MLSEIKKVQVVAELTTGTNVKKVIINSLSMTHCVARLSFKMNPRQQVILRLYEDKGKKGFFPFKAIKTTVESFRQSRSAPQVYYAKIKFNEIAKTEQGIDQILNPEKYTDEEKNKSVFKAENNSLRGVSVRCHMCSQDHIPFWVLRNKTMQSKANIFGVPCYTAAMSGQDFCDFNLIRVVVCPQCYFASNDDKEFQRATHKEKFPQPPFNKKAIQQHWNETIPARKALLAPLLEGFFNEKRSMEQALLSYDLAIMTCDGFFKAEEKKDIKRRNYDPVRKAVSYLLFKAEILITNKQPQDAGKLLEDAVSRLEKVFPYLNNEPSLRAGLLLGMMNLYLNEQKKVRQYLTFLREYNNDGSVKEGSSEYKALVINTNKLIEAYEDKEDYSKDNLNSFHREK